MSRRVSTQLGPDDSGHDSFLDIVANLVGILVILIMVVGVRARHARSEAASVPEPNLTAAVQSDPESEHQGSQSEVETLEQGATAQPVMAKAEADESAAAAEQSLKIATQEAASLFVDTHDLEVKIRELAQYQSIQEAQRNQLQLIVSAAEKQMQVRQVSLRDGDQRKLELASQIAAAEKNLDDLQRQSLALASQANAPSELAHYPTPLAKTVFGREEHFRLLSGRLTYIPLNKLVGQLQADAKSKLWKMEKADRITEVIGPADGFRMRYIMHRVERRVMTPSGPATARAIELDRFELVPVSDILGEEMPTALSENSSFALLLATLDPRETTITIWTYPDSFAEFREVREILRERGFLTAARPLPHGRLIGGSPDGNKSLAQ